MRKKNRIILIFLFIFIIIAVEKKTLANEINLNIVNSNERFVNVQVSSDIEMEKIYLYQKNSSERYTIFMLVNAQNEKNVNCRISIDKLSITEDTDIKVIATQKDNGSVEKTISIPKMPSERTPIPSVSKTPRESLKPSNTNKVKMTTVKPIPQTASPQSTETPKPNEDNAIQPKSISIQNTVTLSIGETTKLKPIISPGNAIKTVTWSTDNENVATVSSSGVVKAEGKGNAIITVKTSNGLTETCSVTVNEMSYGDTLATAACRLAYSTYKNKKGRILNNWNGYYGTKLYIKYRNGGKKPHGCCSRGMSTVINAYLKYDTGLKKTSAGKQYTHMKNSKLWKRVGTYKRGMEDKSNSILKPGDIVISNTHTCMYVGNKIPGQVYETYLKGTDADYGKPGSNHKWVSGSWKNRVSLYICPRKYRISNVWW